MTAKQLPPLEKGHGEFFVATMRRTALMTSPEHDRLFAAIAEFIESQSPALFGPSAKGVITHYGAMIPQGCVGLLLADGAHLTAEGKPSVWWVCVEYDSDLAAEKRARLTEVSPNELAATLYHETKRLLSLAEQHGQATPEIQETFYFLIHSALSMVDDPGKIDALITDGLIPGVVMLHTANSKLSCVLSPLAVALPMPLAKELYHENS